MSAILGIISRNGKAVNPIFPKMMKEFDKFNFDKRAAFEKEDACFFNCVLEISPESRYEKLPLEENNLVIVADAIIDNRDELFNLLNLQSIEKDTCPDSKLILETYKAFGEKCTDYLVGDFAFAIYNKATREVFCVRDHVGKRTLYYYLDDEIVAFSTLINPLLHISDKTRELNETWIAGFLAMWGPIHELNIHTTIYKNIHQLALAHTMKVSPKNHTKNKYWDPLKVKKLKLRTQEEYFQKFMEIYSEAVKCRIRTHKKVGIMLSGGLDSCSVAALAAPMLAEKNKELLSYTFVPIENYENWLPQYSVPDETPYINEMVEMYPNIKPRLCRFPEKNGYNNMDELLKILEHPYKFTVNYFWLNEIVKEATSEGCGVLLDGQFGNFTVSFGDIENHLATVLKKGRFIKHTNDVKKYCQIHNIKRRTFYKYLLKLQIPLPILTLYAKIKKSKVTHDKPQVPLSFIKKEFSEATDIYDYIKRTGYRYDNQTIRTVSEIKEFINKFLIASQVAEPEAKTALGNCVKRDPTRDKRLIEFIFSVPEDVFILNGIDRAFVRIPFWDKLPKSIVSNFYLKGRQSADYIQRLTNEWDKMEKEILQLCEYKKLDKYVDLQKLKVKFLSLKADKAASEDVIMNNIVSILNLSRFMKEGGFL